MNFYFRIAGAATLLSVCLATEFARGQQPNMQPPQYGAQPRVYVQPGAFAQPAPVGVNAAAGNVAPALAPPSESFDPFATSKTIRTPGTGWKFPVWNKLRSWAGY